MFMCGKFPQLPFVYTAFARAHFIALRFDPKEISYAGHGSPYSRGFRFGISPQNARACTEQNDTMTAG